MAGITFPISLLCTVKGQFGPLSQMDQEIERMSMRIRLTGRDMMRLGGAIEGFFNRLKNSIVNVLQGSLDWAAGMEDIQWALEDIGAVIGDALAPVLEFLANLLESVAQVLEDNPWMAYAVGVLLIIALLGILLGKIMSLVGALNIWFGVLLRVKQAHVGLGASLQGVVRYIVGGKDALESYLTGLSKTNKTTSSFQPTLEQSIAGLSGQGQAAGKAGKDMKKLGKNTKGAMTPMKGIGIAAGLFGLLVGFLFAAEPLMELFGSIVEAIEPALEILAEALEPVIDWIAGWIEANPVLAAGIITAIAAILLLVSQADSITAFFGGIMGFLKGAPAAMPTLKTNILQIAEAIFVLAGAVSVLVLSMGTAIWILSQTRFTLPEIITLIWNLTAAVIMLGGVFFIFALLVPAGTALASLTPVLLPLALVLLAIGAAAFLVGAGFFLMGLGVAFAAQGILSLVSVLPQVAMLVPLVFGLAAGFGVLALTALLAVGPLIALAGSFMVLSIAIIALAGALALLAALGDWGKSIATSIGMGLASALIPRMQEGGTVLTGGMAILHPAEEVVPARVAKGRPGGGVPSTINVNFYGPVTSKDFVEREVVPVVKKAVNEELRRK